jgi:hypothetical protein
LRIQKDTFNQTFSKEKFQTFAFPHIEPSVGKIHIGRRGRECHWRQSLDPFEVDLLRTDGFPAFFRLVANNESAQLSADIGALCLLCSKCGHILYIIWKCKKVKLTSVILKTLAIQWMGFAGIWLPKSQMVDSMGCVEAGRRK